MALPCKRVVETPKLQARRTESHKGDYGRVTVIAGSRGLSGAAILCGRAALSGGAGLVTVACPREIQEVVAMGHPCYMICGVPVRFEDLLPTDVVAIGPGLGHAHNVKELLGELLTRFAGPLVIDADALNAIPREPIQRVLPAVLTPHPGEFARMIGKTVAEVQADREGLAVAYARARGVVLLLKGHRTVVTDGAQVYLNETGNPGMATGGCGDVLTGLIAALLGQKLAPFEAALLGAWVHGRAGDLAVVRKGEVSLTALDLLDELPAAILERSEMRT